MPVDACLCDIEAALPLDADTVQPDMSEFCCSQHESKISHYHADIVSGLPRSGERKSKQPCHLIALDCIACHDAYGGSVLTCNQMLTSPGGKNPSHAELSGQHAVSRCMPGVVLRPAPRRNHVSPIQESGATTVAMPIVTAPGSIAATAVENSVDKRRRTSPEGRPRHARYVVTCHPCTAACMSMQPLSLDL